MEPITRSWRNERSHYGQINITVEIGRLRKAALTLGTLFMVAVLIGVYGIITGG